MTVNKTDAWPLITNGIYKHYKGNLYKVLGVARHSETEEWMVLYEPQYGEGGYWVRPYNMFLEEIEVDGIKQQRFSLVKELT